MWTENAPCAVVLLGMTRLWTKEQGNGTTFCDKHWLWTECLNCSESQEWDVECAEFSCWSETSCKLSVFPARFDGKGNLFELHCVLLCLACVLPFLSHFLILDCHNVHIEPTIATLYDVLWGEIDAWSDQEENTRTKRGESFLQNTERKYYHSGNCERRDSEIPFAEPRDTFIQCSPNESTRMTEWVQKWRDESSVAYSRGVDVHGLELTLIQPTQTWMEFRSQKVVSRRSSEDESTLQVQSFLKRWKCTCVGLHTKVRYAKAKCYIFNV